MALPAAAYGDCAVERQLALSMLGRSQFEVLKPGTLIETQTHCQLDGAVLSSGNALSLELGRLEWRIVGLETFGQGGVGRVALDLSVTGARIVPKTEDRWLSYMLDVQNQRNLIDVALDGSWDFESEVFEVNDFIVDLRGNNRMEARFKVSGLGAGVVLGDMTALSGLKLMSLQASIENGGFLDGLILGAVIGQLSSLPGTPESVMEATKTELAAIVAAWPDEVFDEESRGAITQVIADGPAPWGRVDIKLLTQDGISVQNIPVPVIAGSILAPDTIARAFEGARVAVQYTPAEPQR